MGVDIKLELNHVKLIFANVEVNLMEGGRIYYSQRHMLLDIFKQIPFEWRQDLLNNCPEVFKVLTIAIGK